MEVAVFEEVDVERPPSLNPPLVSAGFEEVRPVVAEVAVEDAVAPNEKGLAAAAVGCAVVAAVPLRSPVAGVALAAVEVGLLKENPEAVVLAGAALAVAELPNEKPPVLGAAEVVVVVLAALPNEKPLFEAAEAAGAADV